MWMLTNFDWFACANPWDHSNGRAVKLFSLTSRDVALMDVASALGRVPACLTKLTLTSMH